MPPTMQSNGVKDEHDQRNQMAVEGKDVGDEKDLSNGAIANASPSKGLKLGGFSPSKGLAKMGASFKNIGKSIKRLYKKLKNPISKWTGRMTKDAVKAQDSLKGTGLENKTDSDLFENAKGKSGGINTEVPDWIDAESVDAPTTRYVATLAVSQDDPKWLDNVNELKKAAFHKLRTSPKKFINAVKEGKAEEYLGSKVINYRKRKANNIVTRKQRKENKKLEIPDEDFQREVERFTGGIHDVGHTWIRLEKYSGEGGSKLQSRYSYGMWPAKYYDFENDDSVGGYGGFSKPGPGFIRHPDIVHEKDADKVYKSVDASKTKFSTALAKAQKLRESPPPYVLMGYNCTSFAKEIFELAGGSYPGSGLLPSIGYTPGNLYHEIMAQYNKDKNKGKESSASTVDSNTDVTEQVSKETEDRENKFTNPSSVKVGSGSSVSNEFSIEIGKLDYDDYVREFNLSESELQSGMSAICNIIPFGNEHAIGQFGLKSSVEEGMTEKKDLEKIETLGQLLALSKLTGLSPHELVNEFMALFPELPVTKLAQQALSGQGQSYSVAFTTGDDNDVPSLNNPSNQTSTTGEGGGNDLYKFHDSDAYRNSIHPDDVDRDDHYENLSMSDQIKAQSDCDIKLDIGFSTYLEAYPLWKCVQSKFWDAYAMGSLSPSGRAYLAFVSGEPLKIVNELCDKFKL